MLLTDHSLVVLRTKREESNLGRHTCEPRQCKRLLRHLTQLVDAGALDYPRPRYVGCPHRRPKLNPGAEKLAFETTAQD